MPEQSGALTHEETKKITDWIFQHWKAQSKTCPVCTSNAWTVGPYLVDVRSRVPGGGVIVGGPVYPEAVLVCLVCGYTMFFNALTMGVVKEKPKEKEKVEENLEQKAQEEKAPSNA
jgi:hypothetical protein